MMISLFRLFDRRYVSRISEYVIPPATKTIIRCRLSLCVPAPRVALCQLGFWLRSDTAGWTGDGAERKLLVVGVTDGESLTYGKTLGSSLFATWSCGMFERLLTSPLCVVIPQGPSAEPVCSVRARIPPRC